MENGQGSKGNGMAIEKDDIVLAEGDFTTSEIDGVPLIKFSERVNKLSMARTAVVKLL